MLDRRYCICLFLIFILAKELLLWTKCQSNSGGLKLIIQSVWYLWLFNEWFSRKNDWIFVVFGVLLGWSFRSRADWIWVHLEECLFKSYWRMLSKHPNHRRLDARSLQLYLQSNKISEISKNVFRVQRKLRILLLSYNQIKVLAPGVFDPLTSLIDLWLDDNLIDVIEDSLFSKNEKFDKLYLEENKIFAVGPNAFQQLTKLRELRLFGNPCMHPNPNLTIGTNPQNLGIFFSEEYGNME